jgi:hypothetical protein
MKIYLKWDFRDIGVRLKNETWLLRSFQLHAKKCVVTGYKRVQKFGSFCHFRDPVSKGCNSADIALPHNLLAFPKRALLVRCYAKNRIRICSFCFFFIIISIFQLIQFQVFNCCVSFGKGCSSKTVKARSSPLFNAYTFQIVGWLKKMA